MTDPVEYRVAHLHEALTHDPRVHEQSLEIRVEGDRIVLRGELATPERCAAALAVTRELFPDAVVVDDLRVAQQRPADGAPERL